jgi:hypothetical protein
VEVEAYLVQAQTLEGLSGSPVFIQQFSQIPGLSTPGGGGVAGYGDQKLLGIYQGAWDGEPGAILSADRNLKGDNLRVPVGMGIIVPGERILELVKNDPTFKEIQDDVRRHRLKKNAASADSAFSPPTADANPNHLEDFKRLVGAAVKKREPED